jgi:hypothetical protein
MATELVVLTGQLYVELASSALTLVPGRSTVRSS